MTKHLKVCPLAALAHGTMRVAQSEGRQILVASCRDGIYAIENRCSHDDGPLADGDLDAEALTVECPRHGSIFDLRTGRPLRLPATRPVGTFPVSVRDGEVWVQVD